MKILNLYLKFSLQTILKAFCKKSADFVILSLLQKGEESKKFTLLREFSQKIKRVCFLVYGV